MDEKQINKELDGIRDASYENMVGYKEDLQPGKFYITGLQAGNHCGENGLWKYVGYAVQVRKESGAFGSDLVLLRHPNGELTSHENQCFFKLDSHWITKVKKLYEVGVEWGEYDNDSLEYTLGDDKYPEIGFIVHPTDNPPKNNSPMAKITVEHSDGSKTVEIC